MEFQRLLCMSIQTHLQIKLDQQTGGAPTAKISVGTPVYSNTGDTLFVTITYGAAATMSSNLSRGLIVTLIQAAP
jgi:hypothetical protein